MSAIGDALAIRSKALLGAKPRPGGAVCDDISMLLPGFREQVEAVVADMRFAGFDPRVFETFRSAERVAELVKRGTGSPHSMHPYGIACDIICAKLLWNPPQRFWLTLAASYESRGLTAGARFSNRHDMPHGQGIPTDRQAEFVRANGLTDEHAIAIWRDQFASQFYRVPRQS